MMNTLWIRRMRISWSSRLRWWTNLPAGDMWWRHHGGTHHAVVRIVWQQGWGRTWPWTSGAGGGGGRWGGNREEGEGSARHWAQTAPVAVQVGGIGWTVVVKTIGQLNVCALVGGGITNRQNRNKYTMGKITEMINYGKHKQNRWHHSGEIIKEIQKQYRIQTDHINSEQRKWSHTLNWMKT